MTNAPKFIDELPPPDARGGDRYGFDQTIAALRASPGKWAEIARYPREKRYAAYGRARAARERCGDLESAVRTVDGQVVLFYRVVPR